MSLTDETCGNIHEFTSNNSDISFCFFVKNVSDCKEDQGFVRYNEFIYCSFAEVVSPIAILIFWLIILLVTLATTADSFFGPCLIIVTRVTRMSQNLAGVTLLAFGNGAADIFSAISAVDTMNSGDAGLAFGSLLGAGLLVNCVTGGVVMIVTPFQVTRRPLFKDLFFYIIAVIWTLSIMIKQWIHLGEAIGFIVLYFIYVVVTLVSRMIFSRSDKFNKEVEISDSNKNDFELSGTQSTNQAFTDDDDKKDSDKDAKHFQKKEGPKSRRFQELDHSMATNLPEDGHEGRRRRLSTGADRNMAFNRHTVFKSSFTGVTKRTGYMAKWVMAHRPEDEYQDATKREREEMMKHIQESRRRTVSDAHGIISAPRKHSDVFLHQLRPRSKTSGTNDGSSAIPFDADQARSKWSPVGKRKSRGSSQLGANDNEAFEFEPKPGEDGADDDVNSMHSVTLEEKDNEEEEPYVYPGQWRCLLDALKPFSFEDWANMSWFTRIIEVFRAPIVIILKLIVPVVDEEAPLEAWCRLLNCFHCISVPVYVIVSLNQYNIMLGGVFPLIVLAAIMGFLIAIPVWFTSKPEVKPIYHPVFAFVGFIVSILWIYTLANEIVNILSSFGIVFQISQALLGLSLLAWANSVGDMMSNLVLARSGYPRIAFSACIGGPLFNLLIGIGVPFTIKCIKEKKEFFAVEKSMVQMILISFLLISIVANVIAIPLMKFKLRYQYGISLIILYVIFFVLAMLAETKVISSR